MNCPFCNDYVLFDTMTAITWLNLHLENHKLIQECKKLGLKEKFRMSLHKQKRFLTKQEKNE